MIVRKYIKYNYNYSWLFRSRHPNNKQLYLIEFKINYAIKTGLLLAFISHSSPYKRVNIHIRIYIEFELRKTFLIC